MIPRYIPWRMVLTHAAGQRVNQCGIHSSAVGAGSRIDQRWYSVPASRCQFYQSLCCGRAVSHNNLLKRIEFHSLIVLASGFWHQVTTRLLKKHLKKTFFLHQKRGSYTVNLPFLHLQIPKIRCFPCHKNRSKLTTTRPFNSKNIHISVYNHVYIYIYIYICIHD